MKSVCDAFSEIFGRQTVSDYDEFSVNVVRNSGTASCVDGNVEVVVMVGGNFLDTGIHMIFRC